MPEITTEEAGQPIAEAIQVEKVVSITGGKTTFAPMSPAPRWATWMFRTEFILSKMLMFYMTGTDRLSAGYVKEVLLIVTAVDLGTWLFANSLGVKKADLGLPGTE